MISKKKIAAIVFAVAAIAVLSTALVAQHVIMGINVGAGLGLESSAGIDNAPVHMHVTISSTKPGYKTQEFYHADHVTYLGLNETFAKLTGNTTLFSAAGMDWGQISNMWNANLTVISIGYNTTVAQVNQSATYVYNEWCRTNCSNTISNGALGQYNFTVTIVPGTTPAGSLWTGASPYTAQWIGLSYYNGTAVGGGYGANDATMFAYDTLTTAVSGIDSTFWTSASLFL
jgi:hypothetical protein